MKFIDLFAGIGGFRLGMKMAGHECVGHCEIDKFADRSYRAMHDVKEDEWYAGDICKVEPGELPEADIWTGGFPCQAFSIAGKRRGFEDMRGTLIFEIFRLAAERKPKILFLENVKGLLNHEGGRTFGIILDGLWELGYDVQWQVLNSKNFGVPQNRERVFIIGHLREGGGRAVFPIRQDGGQADGLQRQYTNTLTTRYEGAQATGSYIVEGQQYAQKINQLNQPKHSNDRIYDEGVMITEATKRGYAVAGEGDSINLEQPNSKTRRGRVGKGVAQTLTTSPQQATIQDCRIRRLTPKECFRLQGFPDEYFNKAAAVNSDSQLYKQAGNSVTVNVIYEIAKRLEV